MGSAKCYIEQKTGSYVITINNYARSYLCDAKKLKYLNQQCHHQVYGAQSHALTYTCDHIK